MTARRGAPRRPRVSPPPEPVRRAVLDLGSTTFQLLVADADAAGSLTPILRDRVVLNLGLVLAGHGHIPTPVAQRAADAARRLRDVAVRAGAERLIPIATSALRDSPNRTELARLLERAIGMPVPFIDGWEEARLAFLGVAASVAIPGGPTLLLDLGGGSLEVGLADDDGLRLGQSLPIGAGRLTGLLIEGDPPSPLERRRVEAAAADALRPLAPMIRAAAPVRAIASGGVAGALARLLAARQWAEPPPSLNQYAIPVARLQALTRRLASLPQRQRLRLPAIDTRRADLLPAGGWILTQAARAFGFEQLTHSEWGLREGAILDSLGFGDRPGPEPADLRRRSVDRLVRLWGEEDLRHLDLTARMAQALFDGTRAGHRLGSTEREWLTHAARLHQVGSRISPVRLHKHGAYLIENGGLRGFSPEEVAAIASLVRFQKGKDPRPAYPPFAGLPSATRKACVVTAGLLRIAHALARGPETADLEAAVEATNGRVVVRLRGVSHPEAIAAEAETAASLLERTLSCRVVIDAG